MDKGMRFVLIAAVPCCLALSWVAAALRVGWLRRVMILLMVAYAGGSLVLYPQVGGRPMMSEEARDELVQMKARIPGQGRSLIVARHGLEWWVSWFTGARIAQPSAVSAADWQSYEAVYYITEKRPVGAPGPGMRPFGPGGPGGGPMRGPDVPEGADVIFEGVHYSLAHVSAVPRHLAPAEFLEPWW
jgi:hypothetical protein